jgi:hypothetical protein
MGERISVMDGDGKVSNLATIRRVLVVVSLLLVAWTLACFSNGIFLSSIGGSQTYRIELACQGDAEGCAGIRFRALAVDGVGRRWKQLAEIESGLNPSGMNQGWKLTGDSDPYLEFRPEAGAGSVTFQGRHFVADLENASSRWPVELKVFRGGELIRTESGSRWQGQDWAVVSEESPNGLAVAGMAALIALLFGGVAYRPRAFDGGSRLMPYFVMVISVVHLGFWASQCVGLEIDGLGYYRSWDAVARGEVGFFPPGYPVVVGLCKWIGGAHTGLLLTLVQHVLLMVSAVWLYRMLCGVTAEEWAFVAGTVAFLNPAVLGYSQMVMSETTAMTCMIGGLYFAWRGGRASAVMTGLLAGCGGLLRVVPAMSVLLSLGIREWSVGWRRGRARIAVAVAVAAVVMTAPVVWFGAHTGDFALTYSAGIHLFDRVLWGQQLVNPQGEATKHLAELLDGEPMTGRNAWQMMVSPRVEVLGLFGGAKLLQQVALEAIAADPWGYLSYTPKAAWRTLMVPVAYYPRQGIAARVVRLLENPPLILYSEAGLKWRIQLEAFFAQVWQWLCWGSLAGFAISTVWGRGRWLFLAVGVMVLVHLLVSASVEIVAPRYHVPLIPLLAMLLVPLAGGWRTSRIVQAGA